MDHEGEGRKREDTPLLVFRRAHISPLAERLGRSSWSLVFQRDVRSPSLLRLPWSMRAREGSERTSQWETNDTNPKVLSRRVWKGHHIERLTTASTKSLPSPAPMCEGGRRKREDTLGLAIRRSSVVLSRKGTPLLLHLPLIMRAREGSERTRSA